MKSFSFRRRKARHPVAKRIIATTFGAAGLALAIKAMPDLRRYLRIKTM